MGREMSSIKGKNLSLSYKRKNRRKQYKLEDLARSLDNHNNNSSKFNKGRTISSLHPTLPAHSRKKLGESLEKSQPQEDHPMLQGILDMKSEDLLETLNTSLHHTSNDLFHDLLKWSTKPWLFLEFNKIKLNRDMSHVTIYWTYGNIMDYFIDILNSNNNNNSKILLINKYNSYVTYRLSQREPQFRSIIARKHYLRRIPRLFFMYDNDNNKM